MSPEDPENPPQEDAPPPSPGDPPAKLLRVRTRLVAVQDLLAGLTSVDRVASSLGVPAETVHLWQRGVIAALTPEDARPEGPRAGHASPLRDALHRVYESVEARFLDKDSLLGVTSGFYDLDHMLGGFQPGTLNVLAGRPAMGRTALALEFARSCAAYMAPVLFYSAETSKDMLVARLLGTRAQVDSHRLRTGYLTEQDWERLSKAIAELADLPIIFADDPTLTVADLRAEARRIKADRGGLGLVVVDPVEMLRAGPTGDPEASAQRTAHGLKRLARELDTAVLALAPVSGAVENRRDPRPTLADVRGGDALIELADVVMLLYRDEYYHDDSRKRGSAEVIVARHRQGPIGHIEVYFDANTQRFAPISARSYFEP